MKVEFELTINENGLPCIKFRHYDKSKELDQMVLNAFIKSVNKNGIVMVNTSGYLGDDISY